MQSIQYVGTQEVVVGEKVLPEVRTIELSELEGYLSQKLGNQT